LTTALDSYIAILQNGRNDRMPVGQDRFLPRRDKGGPKQTMTIMKANQERMIAPGKPIEKKQMP
jgi:hypothetical protein